MSLAAGKPRLWAVSPSTRSAVLRGAVLVLLLFVESWIVRLRYTTLSLDGIDAWWVPLVQAIHRNTVWGVCVLGAIVLIGRSRLLDALQEVAEQAALRPLPAIPLHVASFAAFYLMTGAVLEGTSVRGALALPWLLAWLASALLVLVTLLWIAVPLATLRRFVIRTWWIWSLGLVTGSLAFVVGELLGNVWGEPLAAGTLVVARAILGVFFEGTICEPEYRLLQVGDFPVIVTSECSGYEGVSLFFVFYLAFVVLWRERLRFPNVLLLLPLGMGLVWLLNSVRVAALVALGAIVSPEVAIEGFHLNAGWAFICLVCFGFVMLVTRAPFFAARPVAALDHETVNPTALYLGPLLALVGASFVVGAFTATPQTLYPLRVLAALAVLWVYRKELGFLRPGWSWSAAGLGVLGFVLWAGLHPYTSTQAAVVGGMDWQAGHSPLFLVPWWCFRAAGALVVVPVAEELAFRGYLLRRLAAADFEAVSPKILRFWPAFLSSVVFGLLHHDWVAGTLIGLLYAVAVTRRGRLWDAVLAHGITNGLLLAAAAFAGRWSLIA